MILMNILNNLFLLFAIGKVRLLIGLPHYRLFYYRREIIFVTRLSTLGELKRKGDP